MNIAGPIRITATPVGELPACPAAIGQQVTAIHYRGEWITAWGGGLNLTPTRIEDGLIREWTRVIDGTVIAYRDGAEVGPATPSREQSRYIDWYATQSGPKCPLCGLSTRTHDCDN